MRYRRRGQVWLVAVAAAATGLAACSAQPPAGPTPEALLTTNGLTTNGLTTNGLASVDFLAWFEADAAVADMVMRYIAKCALPAGQSLSLEWNGTTFTWYGGLGLAPHWGSGEAIPFPEQQLVTACLAAHSNRYGLHVALSVRGPTADGSYIPLDPGEEDAFAQPEGCFFGNFFDGSGIYSGAFLGSWTADETNPRGCAVEAGLPGDCPPIQHVGSCDDVCTLAEGAGPTVYASCTLNGQSYLPLTTYLSADSVFVCGDGYCQFTESRWDPETFTGCPDCHDP